jgi:cellulose synthase/poly-beta-1,6-N-acetylglucosamine synthase-like glycosyltransferase
MNFLVLLTILVLALYAFKINRYRIGWNKQAVFIGSGKCLTGISVIIAFRNEVENLGSLLSALEKQKYPVHLHEVILVDDYSDDHSDVLVKHFCETRTNFRYVSNEGNKPGKKSAIRNGINHAMFELIVTTDADCVMKEHWLSSIAQYYQESHVDMIIGLVDIDTVKGFSGTFQEIEFLSLIASGAGAAAVNRPIYCNAANLAFRRTLFQQTNDPLQEGIISGDDTFFLHLAKKRHKKIGLLKSTASVVKTNGSDSWKDFVNQRIRWVSKSRYYRDLQTIYTAILVLSVNALFLTALVCMISGINPWILPVLFVVKVCTDYALLRGFMLFYSRKLPFIKFVLYSFIYPFTVVFFATGGLLVGYSWKGRHFRP